MTKIGKWILIGVAGLGLAVWGYEDWDRAKWVIGAVWLYIILVRPIMDWETRTEQHRQAVLDGQRDQAAALDEILRRLRALDHDRGA